MFLVYHLIQMMWSQKVDLAFQEREAFGEAYAIMSCYCREVREEERWRDAMATREREKALLVS